MAQPPTGNPAFFGLKISKPGVPVASATDKQLVLKDDYTTRTYYDNNNSRILLGQLPDSSYGMWVSKVGQDVTTATLNSQLIFNSNQDVLRVVQTGAINVNVSGAGDFQGQVAHGLGVIPAFIGYIDSVPIAGSNVWLQLPFVQHQYSTGAIAIGFVADIAVDNTNVYINISSIALYALGTYSFKYYLLEENLG